MPWHISKSDPRKVYDERHQTVCVCQSPEQAARIVAAVTGQPVEPQTIKLREPEYSVDPGPLETFHDDSCCTKHLMRARRDSPMWECPACGCAWQRHEYAGILRWEPVTDIAFIGLR